MVSSLMVCLFSLVLLCQLIKTNSVTLEVSGPTDSGKWNAFYPVLIPFSIGDKQFVLGQTKDDETVFIQLLLPGGKLGAETERQSSSLSVFTYQFFFSIDGQHFFYGQNKDNRHWYIQEVLSSGKLGTLRSGDPWTKYYKTTIPFSFNGRQFFFGQSSDNKQWFIQQLLPGGLMGSETSNGNFANYYYPQFGYTIDGRWFIYGQREEGNYWFIQELLPGGKMAEGETDEGSFNRYYPKQFPFTVNGRQYFYGLQEYASYRLFINSLLPGGKLGEEVYSSSGRSSGLATPHRFGYSIGGKSYLFSLDTPINYYCTSECTSWAIQEVFIQGNSAAPEHKDMEGATSIGDSNGTSTFEPEILTSTNTP